MIHSWPSKWLGVILVGRIFLVQAALHAAPEPKVAAKVNGEPIFVAEAQREVTRLLAGRAVEPAARRALEAQALAQLIDLRLAQRYLERRELAASPADVELELDRLVKKLGQQKISLAEHLRMLELSEAALRRTLAWQLGWKRYLERHLTDENLRQHFLAHQKEFDGTQLRVAHLLLKLPTSATANDRAQATAKAAAIRADVLAKRLTFAEAAAKYSQAPTAASGGEMGLISRHEPMPEPFSAAAFSLAPGEVSEPVATAFGVHLITCLEVKPGHGDWTRVRSELAEAVTQFLFQRCANAERPGAKIEFTGEMPYFEPGTQNLKGQEP